MGLHVGGIYVEVTKKEITQKTVTDFIREYWVKLGAKESNKDSLQFDSLGLEKTGLLGFAICPKKKDISGKNWIGIYDSERYRADPALARALAIHFDTDVWFYEITDSVNQAYIKKYGKKEEVVKNYDKVLEKVESFPYPLLYFSELKNIPDNELSAFSFLAFEEIPFRPKAQYSGPSVERLDTNAIIIKAKEYAASLNADELIKLVDNVHVYYDVIDDAMENANLLDPKQLAFIYKLAPPLVKREKSFCAMLEAALRMKDEALFEKAVNVMNDYRLYTLERRALELVDKEPYIAFRLIEAGLMRVNYEDTRVFNNAVYILDRTADHTGISAERLNLFLEKAYQAGPQNPSILHNLACVYVKIKMYDKALQCVEDAVKYGYSLIDKLKEDSDLSPIKSDVRFKKAFEQKIIINSLDHLKMIRTYGKKQVAWITPTIGLHLYFKKDKARTGAADLLEQLVEQFPEMFLYYLPSGYLNLSPTKKGKVKRDITLLRKGGAKYGYSIYYNALDDGGAADQRILIELDDEFDGEVTVHLPIDLVKEPQKLYQRLINYASLLPFEVGSAGYSFSVQYEGNGCAAEENLFRLLESYWGFTTSQKSLHRIPKAEFIVPNWLTFLSHEQTKKINLKELPSNIVHKLTNKGVVIQAAEKPFVGISTNPSDLGLFPQVVKVLEPLLPFPKKSNVDIVLDLQANILQKIKILS